MTQPALLPAAPAVADPAERGLPSLSPSRAGDFKACPLRYRFRVVDRLPEPPSPAAVRGTVVHSVLERLFDLDAGARTLAAARDLLPGAWAAVLEQEPELGALFDGAAEGEEAAWLASAADLLGNYFDLEDPRRLAPAGREEYVETVLDDRLVLRGIIDRLDAAPDGALRVVDYKTGSSPGEMWEAKALFQLKFYALVLWRTRGVIPAVLQLLYLADRKKLSYSPGEAELRALERQLLALGDAVARARATGDFQPNRGPLCSWCDFKPLCPAHDGMPPPYPSDALVPRPTVEAVVTP